MTHFLKTRYFLLLMAAVIFSSACGVKKPPTPAYSMPHEFDSMATPSPTPGFSNPSGPLVPGSP
jgi:hypothetical protein